MANIIFRESFDTYANTGTTAVGMGQKWIGSAYQNLLAGRFGGQAARVDSYNNRVSALFDSSTSQLSLGFALYSNWGSLTTNELHLMLQNGSNNHLGFAFNELGEIIVAVKSGSSNTSAFTEIGRAPINSIHPNEWCYVEAEIVLHATTGRVTLFREGQQILNLTNVNTVGSQGATVNGIAIGKMGANSASGSLPVFDDMYVTDSATGRLGPCRSVMLAPTADGGTLNFTPDTGTVHFSRVNQVPMSLTGYLQGSSAGQLDLLTMADLANFPTEIHELNVTGIVHKTDAGSRAVSLGIRSNGVNAQGSDIYVGTSAARYERNFPLNPDGNVAWTRTTVNAAELRPLVTV